MEIKLLAISILTGIALFGHQSAEAQSYDLTWSDRYIRSKVDKNVVDEFEGYDAAPKPTTDSQAEPAEAPRHRMPSYRTPPIVDRSARQPVRQKEVWAETHSVEVIANQDFDFYNDRYRKVARVESLVYRGGYPEDLVHCNRASYDSFSIVIDDLEVGDRYQVRVTWDDGSHKTIEKTITESPQTQVFINEPIYFDSAFGS